MDNRTAVFIVPENSTTAKIERWAAMGGCIITKVRRVDRLVIDGTPILPDPGNQFFLADIILTEDET
jgi:hypothetical protein